MSFGLCEIDLSLPSLPMMLGIILTPTILENGPYK